MYEGMAEWRRGHVKDPLIKGCKLVGGEQTPFNWLGFKGQPIMMYKIYMLCSFKLRPWVRQGTL